MIIHSESYPKEWRYVNRDVNPADDDSKGLKLDAFLKDDRWIRGPQFLGKESKVRVRELYLTTVDSSGFTKE